MPLRTTVEEYVNESNAFEVLGFIKKQKWIEKNEIVEFMNMDRKEFVNTVLEIFARNGYGSDEELAFRR